ncbi:MAG: hypothetical protein RL711_1471 [Bacteroidota bacterium]|jgi:hypothetical protein
MKTTTLLLFLTIIIGACNEKRVDSRRFAQEMKNRQLKRVNQGAIMEECLLKGELLVKLIDTTFKKKLQLELQKNGPNKAMQLCNIDIYGVKDSLAMVYNASIKRTNRAILTTGSKEEKELFDAYLYNEEQQLPMHDNLQDLKNGFVLYTKPIVLQQDICLSCHGEASNALPILQKAYPKSVAFNLKKGSLMGMWSIKLAQQEVIKRMK